jgi:hypothetical protein
LGLSLALLLRVKELTLLTPLTLPRVVGAAAAP